MLARIFDWLPSNVRSKLVDDNDNYVFILPDVSKYDHSFHLIRVFKSKHISYNHFVSSNDQVTPQKSDFILIRPTFLSNEKV